MDDKGIFFILIILAVVGVLIGLGFSGGSLLSNQNSSGFLASAFAAVETDWATSKVGQFLISFDDLKVVHRQILDPAFNVKIFDVDGFTPQNLMYISTDRGLFLSRDGGLTWNRFISSNNELNSSTNVFKVIPGSANGEDYFISTYFNGKGVVWRTYDYFFHLEPLIDFEEEAVYDIYKQGNFLYLAVSNGQIIKFNLTNKESSVVNVFKSPVLRIKKTSYGFYLLFKSGNIGKGDNLESKFEKIEIPGGGWFSSPKVTNFQFNQNGNMYILDSEGVYVSYNGGEKFTLLKHIPIQTKEIDSIGINKGKIYVTSKHKIYISSDGGVNWKIEELPNEFGINSLYFVDGRMILSM